MPLVHVVAVDHVDAVDAVVQEKKRQFIVIFSESPGRTYCEFVVPEAVGFAPIFKYQIRCMFDVMPLALTGGPVLDSGEATQSLCI